LSFFFCVPERVIDIGLYNQRLPFYSRNLTAHGQPQPLAIKFAVNKLNYRVQESQKGVLGRMLVPNKHLPLCSWN